MILFVFIFWHWKCNIAGSSQSNNREGAKMEKTYTVRLEDGTIGTISDGTLDGQSAEVFVGEEITVHLFDENGNAIEQRGVLSEVLEIS